MICDKCGKSNVRDSAKCSYCGAGMPSASGGGGFADILNYSTTDVTPSPTKRDENAMERADKVDMQKLIKKSDNIIKTTKTNSLFGLVAIGLSLLIFISSIILSVITIKTVKEYKEETLRQIEEVNISVDERMTQIQNAIMQIDSKTGESVNDRTNDVDDIENQDSSNKKEKNKGTNDVPNPSSPTSKDAEGNIN